MGLGVNPADTLTAWWLLMAATAASCVAMLQWALIAYIRLQKRSGRDKEKPKGKASLAECLLTNFSHIAANIMEREGFCSTWDVLLFI